MYEPSQTGGPFRQSEIISGLTQHVLTLESVGTNEPAVDVVDHPFAIIATQDCDLEQDFQARQQNKEPALTSILFYEVTSAVALLGALQGDVRKRVMINKDERYHVLQSVTKDQDALGAGIDALGIDFKKYFTIPTAEAYKQLATANRRCVMRSPYLEHFSVRASGFQCRVALPVDHVIQPPGRTAT